MVITHSPTKRSIVFNHNVKISFCVTNAHTEGKCAARQKNKPDLTRVIAESSVPQEVIIKHLSGDCSAGISYLTQSDVPKDRQVEHATRLRLIPFLRKPNLSCT